MVKDYKYCIRHDDREEEDKLPKKKKEYRCQGYVNKKKRCRATVIGSFYCRHHKSQESKKHRHQDYGQMEPSPPLTDEIQQMMGQ